MNLFTSVCPFANHFAKGKYQLTLHPGDGFSSSLALEPMTKPKKIVPIDSWVQAFHVFVGVFMSYFPSDGPGLMKYGSTIQDLAARGHNWRFYDENFRFLRQSPSTSLPWGTTIHWELWLRSQSPDSVKRAQTPASTGKLMPIFVYQGVFVSLTIGVVTVWAVPLGMIALNVMAPTVV